MGIVVGIVIGFIAGIAYAVHTAIAETYSYNMTDDELRESRLLEVCIQLHIEAPACSMIWGGIDTSNGEAIK